MHRNSILVAGILLGSLFVTSAKSEVIPIAGWDCQLFPSYLLATSNLRQTPNPADDTVLGDPNGQLGVLIKSPGKNLPVKVSISCSEFLETSEFVGTLAKKGDTYSITPNIRYKYDRLSKCRQATPATVIFRVQLGTDAVQELTRNVLFRSINDCPLNVVHEEEAVDTSFTFAAFVNEQHPFVDKMLREALDLGIAERFNGYQSKDPKTVIRQVYALWDLLVARDVRYSDITTSVAESKETLSQHVRLIEETVNNSQANCVDGSVLLVSMLRKIGIHANLVIEPGHCYVSFAVDEKGDMVFGLETTAIDLSMEDPEVTPDLFDAAVEEELRGEQSWPSFIYAVVHATEKLNQQTSKNIKGELATYKIIDISEARKIGVLPIPFDGQETFVAYDFSEYVSVDDDQEEEVEDFESDEDQDGVDEDGDFEESDFDELGSEAD